MGSAGARAPLEKAETPGRTRIPHSLVCLLRVAAAGLSLHRGCFPFASPAALSAARNVSLLHVHDFLSHLRFSCQAPPLLSCNAGWAPLETYFLASRITDDANREVVSALRAAVLVGGVEGCRGEEVLDAPLACTAHEPRV